MEKLDNGKKVFVIFSPFLREWDGQRKSLKSKVPLKKWIALSMKIMEQPCSEIFCYLILVVVGF